MESWRRSAKKDQGGRHARGGFGQGDGRQEPLHEPAQRSRTTSALRPRAFGEALVIHPAALAMIASAGCSLDPRFRGYRTHTGHPAGRQPAGLPLLREDSMGVDSGRLSGTD
jgi:hypothetical protein